MAETAVIPLDFMGAVFALAVVVPLDLGWFFSRRCLSFSAVRADCGAIGWLCGATAIYRFGLHGDVSCLLVTAGCPGTVGLERDVCGVCIGCVVLGDNGRFLAKAVSGVADGGCRLVGSSVAALVACGCVDAGKFCLLVCGAGMAGDLVDGAAKVGGANGRFDFAAVG